MNKTVIFLLSLLIASGFAYMVYSSLTPRSSASETRPTLNWGSRVNPSACENKTGAPVMDITLKVKNDIDSAVGGSYWAYDNNQKQIQVWKTTDDINTYCAVVRYEGQFSAIAGQPSPQGSGSIESDFQGTFEGGAILHIVGEFKPMNNPVKGKTDTFDRKCNIDGNGCVGKSWVKTYFPDSSYSYGWWGWIYNGGSHGVWVNSADGNQGDLH